MVVTGHRIDVPVDWNEPSEPQISVFAREVVAAERVDDPKLPAIVWFQGGPGFESGFPDHRGSWLEQLLTRFCLTSAGRASAHRWTLAHCRSRIP